MLEMVTDTESVIPPDNIRLPEAITIRHGDARILSRLFIAADNMARSLGVDLKFRNDFHALMQVNEAAVARGTWYKMIDIFDPDLSVDLGRDNAFWIGAENAAGEVVATACGRIFDWRRSTLADEIRLMYYGGRDVGQKCIVTAPLASKITGLVYYAGGVWVSPEYRGSGISSLLPHVARAYASGRWPLDCAFNMINVKAVGKTHPSRYGYSEFSRSIAFPGSPLGDTEYVVCRLEPEEMYADFVRFAADWREYIRVRQAA
jgi:GNAT superfamily N-acetyltransferase